MLFLGLCLFLFSSSVTPIEDRLSKLRFEGERASPIPSKIDKFLKNVSGIRKKNKQTNKQQLSKKKKRKKTVGNNRLLKYSCTPF